VERVKVKICGITNLEDALLAVKWGADALGFIFAPSPRRVGVEVAKEIISHLPPFIITVGVFVNERRERVAEIAEYLHLHVLQFHGEETPQYCQGFPQKVIKSFRVKDEGILEVIPRYRVDAYLLDTYSPSSWGGTGKTFNWEIAKDAKRYGRIILSGGLNPDNVQEAIKVVSPYAIDVASGVEESLGKKDPEKLKSFILQAKRF